MSQLTKCLFLCGSGICLYFAGFLLSQHVNNRLPLAKNTYVFFALYVIILLSITVVSPILNKEVSQMDPLANPSFFESFTNVVNLSPFKTIMNYLSNYGVLYSEHTVIINTLGKVVVFMPLGFYLPVLFSKLNYFKNFFSTTVLIIFIIESLKLITSSGIFDIDDFILYSLGACITFFIYHIKCVNNFSWNIILKEGNVLSMTDKITIGLVVFVPIIVLAAIFIII